MAVVLTQVEDVDVDGLPKASNKSKYDLDGGGGQVSLLIRLSHKVRGSGSWILDVSICGRVLLS